MTALGCDRHGIDHWLGEATELMLDQAGVAPGSRVLDVAADGAIAEPAAFDAAICRLGLMFLPDVHEALNGIRTALRPGGRLSAIVYAEPEHNPLVDIPLAVIRRRAGLPGRPGPLSLGRPGLLEVAFGAAGFLDVEVESVEAWLELPSAAECLRVQRDLFGALIAHEETWEEIEREVHAFEDADGFSGPCRLLVAGGRRS